MSAVVGLDPISLLLGLVIFYVLWKISQRTGTAGLINKLPGPTHYPLVGNIVEMLERRENALNNIIERQKKFGTLFRMWLGTSPNVVFAEPSDIEVLLKSSKHSEKAWTYSLLHSWLGTGLLTSYGKKWAVHRKLITPTFHFKVLQSFVDVFHENSLILVNKLKEKANTGEEVNIYSYVTLCALDIICETAMGTKINAQSESQNDYVYSVNRMSILLVHRMTRPWLHPNFIFEKTAVGKEYEKHLRTVQGFTEDVIRSRKKALKQKTDNQHEEQEEEEGIRKKLTFLDLLLKSSMENGVSQLSDQDLREEVDTFMFEGHDTTAAGLAWTLCLLGEHPKIQEEVYEELKVIFQGNPDRSPTIADLAEMNLLERVIKESLRLYPSVSSIGRTIEEDIELHGYTIPRGVTAIISIYSLHRNPKFYSNPEVFDPNRFLPENILKRHPYSYLPFSAGPRNCIGQKFALCEEKVILSTIIRNFKVEAVEKTEKVKKSPELILRPTDGIKVRLTKR